MLAGNFARNQALLLGHVTQVNGRKPLSRHAGSEKVLTVFWTAYWQLPQSGLPYHLNGPDHVET